MKLFKKSDESDQEKTLTELRRQVEEACMPPAVEKIAGQELETLTRIGPASAEYTIGLTYIDYLLSLPWNRKTEDNLDIGRAENILNEEPLRPGQDQGAGPGTPGREGPPDEQKGARPHHR